MKMKVYARDAIRQYGVANYVLDEERFREDTQTGELFMIHEEMVETTEQLNKRLARGTFSLSSKSYPVKQPCAPPVSPRPVIINKNPTFKVLNQKSVDKITDRLCKPTFATKMKKKTSTAETGVHSCEKEKKQMAKLEESKKSSGTPVSVAGTPRPVAATPRSRTVTPRV